MAPTFSLGNLLTDGCKFVSLRRRLPFTPPPPPKEDSGTSIPAQRRGKHAFATIVETVFSMDTPRDYTCNTVVNHKSIIERERKLSES
jgi:hypothetical protein